MDNTEKTNKEEQINKEGSQMQESLAGDTLKPQNKSEMLSSALAKMAGLDIEDLSHFLNDTLAQVGNEGKAIPDGASAKNQGTITMKGSVKEDLSDIFAEGEDLSEEFKEKASTLFEAAVHTQVILEREALIEEMNENLEEAYVAIKEEITNKLDAYLDHVVESWLEENQVAIESSLKNELSEEFISGMKDLFEKHYITIPEEKIDIVEGLAEKVTSLEESLDNLINENASLKSDLLESNKNDVIDSVCEGLTMTQSGKLRSLCESVDFNGDIEEYQKRVTIIKENMVDKKLSTPNTGLITEESDPEAAQRGNAPEAVLEPSVRRYSDAISRSVRK